MYPVDKKRVNEFGFGGEDDPALAGADSTERTALMGTDSTEQTEEDKKTN